MEIWKIFGSLATVASLTIVLVGLPQQIWLNFKYRSTGGLASLLFIAAFITYTSWSLYGWTKPDYFLLIAQTPGSILAFILLWQFIFFRDKQYNIQPEIKSILKVLYPKRNIYVHRIEKYIPPDRTIVVACLIPPSHSYTNPPLSDVSAEQYTRCLSQAAYLLVDKLLKDNILAGCPYQVFIDLLKSGQLYYVDLKVKYRKKVNKGEEFILILAGGKIRSVDKNIFLEINFTGPVQGKMFFNAPTEPA